MKIELVILIKGIFLVGALGMVFILLKQWLGSGMSAASFILGAVFFIIFCGIPTANRYGWIE